MDDFFFFESQQITEQGNFQFMSRYPNMTPKVDQLFS